MKCEIRNEQRFIKLDRKLIRSLFRFLGKSYGRSSKEIVSLYIVDNKKIQELNREYLDKDRPTDVLTFNMDGDILGDIVVSAERAVEQAGEQGPEHEFLFLLVHGFLHLLGWTDYSRINKNRMIKEGERALSEFHTFHGNRSFT